MKFSVFSFQFSVGSTPNSVTHALKTKNLKLKATPRALRARGVTVILVLVFMGIFAMLTGSIAGYVFEQGKYGRALSAREQAIHIAEAGIEYYRWFLAHNPSVLQDGTGLVSPYTYQVNDPEGGNLGNATITATTNLQCGVSQWIDIVSEGTADSAPMFPRTLLVRHMRPSVAEYSNMLNSNVWAGADRNITGPYFSNGGIRMDGTNNSDVLSSVSTWSCSSSFGCSPTQSKPGVWGAGSGSALWQFPVSSFDFSGIATNFSTLKTKAQTSGIVLDPTAVFVAGVQQGGTFSSVGGSDQRGFHLVFNANGTVSVYRVTGTSLARGQRADTFLWGDDYHTITSETLKGTYAVPSGCSLIYSEAKTWIEGTILGKVTVVAADTGSYAPDIILQGNINYVNTDGSSGLSAIAEHSVLIPLVSPDDMTVRGIFIAQTGYLGRNYYTTSGSNKVPSQYNSYVKRSTLTTNGTVVSNGRVGTKWTCGGTYCSGYNTRIDNYDRLLAFGPPPFTPAASPDYKFVVWKEQ